MIFGSGNVPAVSGSHDGLAQYAVGEILVPAVQDSVLMHLADKQIMSGETYVIPSFDFLTQVEDQTGEYDPYPEARLSYGSKVISAIDCGLTIPLTRQAVEVAHDELQLLQSNSQAIKEHLTRSLDAKCAAQLRLALVEVLGLCGQKFIPFLKVVLLFDGVNINVAQPLDFAAKIGDLLAHQVPVYIVVTKRFIRLRQIDL